MTPMGKKDVERLLRAHYRAERGESDAVAKAATLSAVRTAMAAERSAGADGRGQAAVSAYGPIGEAVNGAGWIAADVSVAGERGADVNGAGMTDANANGTGATAENASGAGERDRIVTFPSFVAAQARFIRPQVWAAQLALVAAMVAVCLLEGPAQRGLPLASGVLAAATVLVGLPDLLSSAAHRVAELEYACRFDCRAVALARLIVLGCADVAAVTAIALAAPALLGADLFASLVHACAPYFLSCAGALLLVRRCAPSQALLLACAWTLLVAAGAYALFTFVPLAYAQGSVWAWALVAGGSLVWAAREVRAWLGCLASGLDALAPSSTLR